MAQYMFAMFTSYSFVTVIRWSFEAVGLLVPTKLNQNWCLGGLMYQCGGLTCLTTAPMYANALTMVTGQSMQPICRRGRRIVSSFFESNWVLTIGNWYSGFKGTDSGQACCLNP